jgi:hypothetical protein
LFSSFVVDRYGTNLEGGVRSEEHLDQPSGSADDWTSRGGHYFMEPYPTSGQLQTDVSISDDEEPMRTASGVRARYQLVRRAVTQAADVSWSAALQLFVHDKKKLLI